MPRDGSGRSDNAQDLGPETDHHIVHGQGQEPKTDKVARADKTAPMPEPEKGAGLPDMPATAGANHGGDQGGRGSTN